MPTAASFVLASLIAQPAPTPPVAPKAPIPINETLGPFIGHVGPSEASFWSRVRAEEKLMGVVSHDGESPRRVRVESSSTRDRCVRLDFAGLMPDAEYTMQLMEDPENGNDVSTFAKRGEPVRFRTRKDPAAPQSVTIVLGSCQHDDFASPQPIWDEIARCAPNAAAPDAFCLIGDTPYIDSTELKTQRKRYREFFSIPGLAALCARVPTYATWDDHDFGANDTDGNLPGKENARRAFMEYHANAPTGSGDGLGENNLGAYSSFRVGPVEVFLLDCRWFAGTEPSFVGVDPENPAAVDRTTLIGVQQWAWLKRGLKNSTAEFKLLVSGMVWCDEVRPNKPDYWGHYPHEREAVFTYISDEKITGVVLVGGDIHRNRLYKHGRTFSHLDYPLYEVISSPFGSKVMKQGDGANPEMLYDSPDPRTFAAITVDSTKTPATLVVRWINDEGKELHRLDTTAAELRPRGKR